MKSSRLIVLGLLGLVLAFGLMGCKIAGAMPEPIEPVTLKLGDSQSFKVYGPDEIEGSLYYEWSLNGEVISAPGGDGKQFTFEVDPQKYPLSDHMALVCSLYQWVISFYYNGQEGWQISENWTRVDYVLWNVSIVQD
jgi:hypothetical protein